MYKIIYIISYLISTNAASKYLCDVRMQLEKLIAKVDSLDDLSSRKVSALVGAIVADAACLHLEWIYDQDKVLKIVDHHPEPAFWPENHNPFFALPNGQLSGYADQTLQVLNVMVENNGKFDASKVVAHFLKFFGNATTSPYQESLRKRREGKFPIEGPWLHGAIISMIDRFEAGIDPPGSEDAIERDAIIAMTPLILQQVPNLDFDSLKRSFYILTQDPMAIEHHEIEAFILSQFVQDAKDPIEEVKREFANSKIVDEIKDVEDGLAENKSPRELVKSFGMACPLPGSFQSSLVSIINAKNYPDAIRETILCGGDSCTRANFIGACLGAKFGIKGIPKEWLAQVDGIEDIIEKSIKVLK